MVTVSINFSWWQNPEEQTKRRPGSRSNECVAEGRHDHFLLTAAECHSVWRQRNKPETLLRVLHLEHTHINTTA